MRNGSSKWSWETWLFLGLLAVALWLRLRGIDWPRFHPDEYPIGRWIQRGAPDRVYPGGLFVLIAPFKYVWELWAAGLDQVRLYWGHAEALPAPTDYILMGRVFNALLGTATIALVYRIARVVLERPLWAWLTALFMTFAQLHIEHSHYAQTDVPMVFMLCLSLWFWVRHIHAPRRLWWVLAGLTCGYAAGTKFTLTMLVIPWVLYSMWFAFRAPGRRRVHVPLYLLGALLLFAVGLYIANPNMSRWSKFMEGLAHERSRVYGETIVNMGMMAGDIALRRLSHVYALGRVALTLGWGWIVLVAIGLPCFFLKAYRRYAIPLIGIPVMYIFYWIMLAPWVRNQEFLNFLPFAALLAVLPLRVLQQQGAPKAVRVLGACLLLFGVYGTVERGLRVSSVFSWQDTRLLAERWLQRHEPDDLVSGTERYAEVMTRGWQQQVDMAARLGVDQARAEGLDLFISQGTPAHRGMDHPVTKELYPQYAEAYDRFWAETEHLKSWSLMPDRSTRTTFNSIQVELLALAKGSGAHEWPYCLPQPVWASALPYETYQAKGAHLGSAIAVEVTEAGRTVAVSDRRGLDGPVYLILYTRERPATVRVRGLGRRERVELAPFASEVVALQRPAYRPRLAHVEKIDLRALPMPHVHEIPCYARIAFTEEEVARALADIRRELQPAPVTLAEWQAARAMLEQAAPETIRYQGVSVQNYNRFARIHLVNQADTPQQTAIELPLLPPPGDAGPEERWFRNIWQTGVQRTGAPSMLRLQVQARWPDRDGPDEFFIRFREEGSGRLLGEYRGVDVRHTALCIELALPRGQAGELAIRVEAPIAVDLTIQQPELVWDFYDTALYVLDTYALAQADQCIANGDAEAARAWLASVALAADDPLMLPYRRIAFTAALLLQEPEPLMPAARELLALAPDHAQAHALVQGANEMIAKEAVARFLPYLAVRSVTWQPDAGVADVTMEALRDFVPPLMAVSLRAHRRKWRTIERVPLTPDRPIAAGEQFTVTLNMRGPNADPAKRALAIETDVRWVPGRFPADTTGDVQVPFITLLPPI